MSTTRRNRKLTPDKAGVRKLYTYIRKAFPDFHPEIHFQLADGDRVTTYKTYYGTHGSAVWQGGGLNAYGWVKIEEKPSCTSADIGTRMDILRPACRVRHCSCSDIRDWSAGRALVLSRRILS